MSNERIEMRGDERCIVDDAGVIAVVFGDDPAEANAILRDMQRRAAVAEVMRREAVQAELIADLRAQCVRNLELGAYGVGYWEDALESIDAALARVQGGQS